MQGPNFNRIVEESLFPSTMKFVTRVRYPKQIQFSEKFIKSLQEEFARLQTLAETQDPEQSEIKPIRNYKDKFLKAVNFCVSNFK
jgi:cysteinyl-tRNA synthetase